MALSSKVTKALAKLSKQDKNGLFSSEIAALETALDGVADKEALRQVKAESKAVKAGNKYYNSAFKASSGKASSGKAYAEAKANEAKAATEAGEKAEIKNIKANIKAVKAAVKSGASDEYVQAVKDSAEADNAKVFAQLTKQLKKGKVSDSDAVKLAKALDDAEGLSKADVKELVAALKKGNAEAAIDKVEEIVKGEEGGDGDVTPDPEAPGQTSVLTEALEAQKAAQTEVTSALKELNEALTKIGYTGAALKATAEDVAKVGAIVEDRVLENTVELLTARNTDVTAAGSLSGSDAAAAATEIAALATQLKLAAGTKLSDAVLDQLLGQAQKNIDDAKELYLADGVTQVAKVDGKAAGTYLLLSVDAAGEYTAANNAALPSGDTQIGYTEALGVDSIAVAGDSLTATFDIPEGFNGIIEITDAASTPVKHLLLVENGTLKVPASLAGILDANQHAITGIAQAPKAGSTTGETTVTITGGLLTGFTAKSAALVETKTVKDLQTAIATAETALEAHKTAMGDEEQMLTTLKGLLADYATVANAGETVANIASANTVAALVAKVDAVLAPVSKTYTESARDAAIKALIAEIEPVSSKSSITTDIDTTVTPNVDRAEAVNNFLAEIEKLDTLKTAVTSAENAFKAATLDDTSTPGADFVKVEDAVTERADQVELAEKAEAAVDGIQTQVDALQAAMDKLAAANEALGFEVENIEAGAIYAGTKDADLFLLDADKFAGVSEDGTLALKNFTVNSLEKGDALFLAGWTYNEGKLTEGDNNALEFFITQSGSNTVITYETKEFGSAVTGETNTITLTGVTEVSVEDGVILIG